MKTHYDLNTALYAIGIKSKCKRAIFLYTHRGDFDAGNITYGIGIARLADVMGNMSRLEKWFYGVKFTKREGQTDGE